MLDRVAIEHGVVEMCGNDYYAGTICFDLFEDPDCRQKQAGRQEAASSSKAGKYDPFGDLWTIATPLDMHPDGFQVQAMRFWPVNSNLEWLMGI